MFLFSNWYSNICNTLFQANIQALSMQILLLDEHWIFIYKIEYVCWIPNVFRMDQALTQLAVKILFDDSTGFDEMRWTIILPEKQKSWICLWLG